MVGSGDGRCQFPDVDRLEFSVNTVNVMRHKVSFDALCLTFEVLVEKLKFLMRIL